MVKMDYILFGKNIRAILGLCIFLILSGCLDKEEKAQAKDHSEFRLFAAEMHVHCESLREARFLGPFRSLDEVHEAGEYLRAVAIRAYAAENDYQVTFENVRVFVKGIEPNQPILSANIQSLECI